MITKLFFALLTLIVTLFSTCDNNFVAPVEEAQEIKNVVIMIGDGMGFNHLYSTQDTYGISLEMLTRTEFQGQSRTRSSNDSVTDSAAGGSALSMGLRTMNGYIAVYPTDPLAFVATPASITEVAIKYGKSTGVVTSDSIMGATPSAFSAHVRDRDLAEDIFEQQVASDIDLIWGAAADIVTVSEVEANGKEYVASLSEVQALEPGQQSIGQFDSSTLWKGTDNGDNPTLSELTVEALELLSADEDGFFLMVEGAHIDKRSHDQDGDGARTAVLEFDKAISAVLDFAEENGNTLVIITADHETGSVTLQEDGSYKWTTGSHSSANVPVLVYGSDSFIENGEVLDNKDIPYRAVAFMTNNEQAFPCPLDCLY